MNASFVANPPSEISAFNLRYTATLTNLHVYTVMLHVGQY